ncbi:SDR family oxidoreductase [Microcoleus sp. MON2_D6]|uniref:SDR family oxidoreductase n=1 Tax=unclassified Microcoleus TaxID=2642155 RepID=UPI002FD460A5
MPTSLITGASGGIGAAFAAELAKRQHNLILVARSEDKLRQLAAQLQQEFNILVEIIVQDLTAPGATNAVFDAVVKKGWTVDLLVNNAGFGDYGAFADRPLAKQLTMVQLNIVALVELSHLFLQGMRERKSGSIINVASIAAFQPMPYLSMYAATKAFVLSFSEALWAENKDLGIRVLCLCPGPTESNFFAVAEFPQSMASSSWQKLVPAAEVVRDALKALDKNESNVVTGGIPNQIIANMPRLMPRELLVKSVEKVFRAKDE